MEAKAKRIAKSTELPKELLSTVTLTTYLLPTKARIRTHRDHPPDYWAAVNTGGTSNNRDFKHWSSAYTTSYYNTNKIKQQQKLASGAVGATSNFTFPTSSSTTTTASPAFKISHHRKNKSSRNRTLTKMTNMFRRMMSLHIRKLPTASAEAAATRTSTTIAANSTNISTESFRYSKQTTTTPTRTGFRFLPSLGATSFFTLLTLVCLETILLSTVSNCAKTFYMHWNTSNSIFRIDNTDHIIDVNKGNLAFEFDQVHIICPVYEPGTFENETEKYIIYNVSKVEYETCRITNADPRVIAICDKPQKLMFFTITFRPFTPQPGGLEFLPGNDYYFISTSSKDDLYRRIGGRCSTNNMKVVFKVCCAPEEKNKTTNGAGSAGSSGGASGTGGSISNGGESGGNGVGALGETSVNVDGASTNTNQQQHLNNINTNGLMTSGGININSGNNGIQLTPLNGQSGTSINTNIDQFNRIPMQSNGINVMGNNIGGVGLGSNGGIGIMLTPGHGGINMIPTGANVGIGQYPGYPGQTGIRINNVPSQHHPSGKINSNSNSNNNNGKDVGGGEGVVNIGFGNGQLLPPIINTNHSNIVHSTMHWPGRGTKKLNSHFINNQINISSNDANENNYYSPSHRPTNHKKNKNVHYDKHPNEVVKNEELTYNSAAVSARHQYLQYSWKLSTSICTFVTMKLENFFDILYTITGSTISKNNLKIFKIMHKHQFSINKNNLEIKGIILNFNPMLLLSMFLIIITNCIFKYTVLCSLSMSMTRAKSSTVCVKTFQQSAKSSYMSVTSNKTYLDVKIFR